MFIVNAKIAWCMEQIDPSKKIKSGDERKIKRRFFNKIKQNIFESPNIHWLRGFNDIHFGRFYVIKTQNDLDIILQRVKKNLENYGFTVKIKTKEFR